MEQEYYIHEGVRRAVAAREAGLVDLPAKLQEQGKAEILIRVALSQLHSPKRQVQRDSRYIRDVEFPTQVLKTEPPPIEIEALGAPGQSGSVPLDQVILS